VITLQVHHPLFVRYCLSHVTWYLDGVSHHVSFGAAFCIVELVGVERVVESRDGCRVRDDLWRRRVDGQDGSQNLSFEHPRRPSINRKNLGEAIALNGTVRTLIQSSRGSYPSSFFAHPPTLEFRLTMDFKCGFVFE